MMKGPSNGTAYGLGNILSLTPAARKEPIKWCVLQVDGNDAFLLADQCLASQPFDYAGKGEVTRETCSLRAWLNRELLEKVFSAEEQNAIIGTTLITNGTYCYNADDGIRTADRVFVLAIEDVLNPVYGFSVYDFDRARVTTSTAYSESAPDKKIENSMNWWWLRTSGISGSGSV